MALNQKAFERKLQNMNSTQESVQTVSLWIIHHKKQADEIVLVWLDQLRKAPKPDRRLTLFYLANDVLQNSRKKTKDFIAAYSRVLREAMPLLSDKSIETSVQRVINIWEERKVFENDFLQGLRSKLAPESRKDKKKESKHKAEEAKPQKAKRLPPADFKPSKLVESVEEMRDFEADLTLKESQLNSLRIDASDAEIIGHLKDRAGSTKFWQEYEEASHKLEEFCETLVKEQEQRSDMISLFQDGEAFFDVAFGEVKVIVNAYKTFGNRLNSLKKKLDAKINRLAVKEAERAKTGPVSAPTGSFLSTGLPQMMSDSAASSPTQTPTRKDEGETKLKDTTVDNIEVSDMDLEEDSDSEEEKTENSDASASQSSRDNTPSQTSSSSDAKAVDPVSSSLPSATTSNTVTNTSAEPSATPTASIPPTATSVPNPEKPTAVETPQIAVTPSMLASQTALLSTQTALLPPPIPPSFVGIGMPVQFASAGFGVPQLVGLRTPLQNGPGPLLMTGSGIPTIPYQQQVGGVPVGGGLPGNTPGVLQPGISGGIAPFAAPQNQIALAENLVTTTDIASSTPATTTIVQVQAGCAVSAAGEKEDDRASTVHSSPQSDSSAPSPEGSPELNLDDVELSSSQSNLNGLQTNRSFLSNIPSGNVNVDSEKEVQNSTSAKKADSSSVAQAKDSEAAANLSPAQAQQDGKSVSAVDILAQLLSRGRQLKELSGTQTPPRMESPPSNTPPHVQPVATVETQQPDNNQKKPLLSLIDSLFPKLSDSLKTLKQKEQAAQIDEQNIEQPQHLYWPGHNREIPSQNHNSNSSNFRTAARDRSSNLPPKSILKKSLSSDMVPQPEPHAESQNQHSHDTGSGSEISDSCGERDHVSKLVPPTKIEMERLQARKSSQESTAFSSSKPDQQRSPGSLPPERHPFERHSSRSTFPDGMPRRTSRDETLKVQEETSRKPHFATQGEEKRSPRGQFSERESETTPGNAKVGKATEEEQSSKAALGEASHDKQEAQERKGPPITNAPLVGQSGTFGYTKQDPTVASDFGREPHSPERVQVSFPVRPTMNVGPRGPGGDFMGLRGPQPRPGPWTGPPRDVPPRGPFAQQPHMQAEGPFQGVMREREMIHPDFDHRREFRGNEPLPPEHFQQQRLGPYQRMPEEGRAHPGPFSRAQEENHPHRGPLTSVPEEGHPIIPEGHHPPGVPMLRAPEEPQQQPGPFPRNPGDGPSPRPRFIRGPGDHAPPGHFAHGPEIRLPPAHIMRRPEVHPPNEPRNSESFHRSPECPGLVDFRNDDPSTWTSFEGGRRTPPHMVNQEQRRGNMFPERPINSRIPHEEQRHPFQNFNDNNDLAQRDFMMKRPGPPIRLPGPPPHKRPFPF